MLGVCFQVKPLELGALAGVLRVVDGGSGGRHRRIDSRLHDRHVGKHRSMVSPDHISESRVEWEVSLRKAVTAEIKEIIPLSCL